MTQLFLTAIPSDNGGTGELLMSPNRGAISTGHVTNTTASGTSIQETATGGGTAIVYLSEPLAAGIVFTSGSTTITASQRGKEAATGNNAGVGGILAVVNNANSSVLATLLAETGYPTTAGITEFSTTDAAKALTSTTVGASYTTTGGERLRYTLKVKNAGGTMGAGTPGVTLTFNGPTSGAAGDSFVTPGATLTPQAITGKARQIKSNFLLDGPTAHTTWPTTLDFNVVANAAIMVRFSWDNSGSGGASTTVASVTDNQGNTYTALAPTLINDTTNGNKSQVFYLPGGTVTAGAYIVTANPGAGTGFINPTMTIIECPGMGTVSSSNGNNANGTTAANNVTGGAVTSLSGDSVYGLYWDDGGTGTSQPVAGTGYTMRQAGIETTFNTPHAVEEKVNVSAGSQTATFTAGNADWYICQTVSLSQAGSSFSGSAAFGATVTLTTSGNVPAISQAASFGASVALTTTAKPAIGNTAALGATVLLTTTDIVAVGGAAALSGGVALSTSGLPTPSASPSFTASALLSATAKPAISQAAALAASVLLSTTAVVTASGTAALSGGVALSTSGKPAFAQSAAFAAAVSLATTGLPNFAQSAAYTASVVLSSTGTPAVSQSAALSAGVALSTADTPAIGGIAALGATVLLSATGTTGGAIPVGFTATVTLSTTDKPAIGQAAAYSASVVLTTIDAPSFNRPAGFTGGVSLATTGAPAFSKAAALAASVTLATTGKPQVSSSLGFTAAAILSALGVPRLAGAPALSAGVTLSATGTVPQVSHNYKLTARLTGVRRYAAIIGARRYEAAIIEARRYASSVGERRYSGSVGERRYQAIIEDD